jgi:hypothetical protein
MITYSIQNQISKSKFPAIFPIILQEILGPGWIEAFIFQLHQFNWLTFEILDVIRQINGATRAAFDRTDFVFEQDGLAIWTNYELNDEIQNGIKYFI